MTEDLMQRARGYEALIREELSGDAADTILDLLAEVERLTKDRNDAVRCMDEYHSDRIKQRARAEAAEARLRELASAEPDAWQFQDRDGRWLWFTNDSHRENTMRDGSWPIRALIRRPVMP